MTNKIQHADAGAQPAQPPNTPRELAEVVKDWEARDQAWPHPDPGYHDVAQFGHISEDGHPNLKNRLLPSVFRQRRSRYWDHRA